MSFEVFELSAAQQTIANRAQTDATEYAGSIARKLFEQFAELEFIGVSLLAPLPDGTVRPTDQSVAALHRFMALHPSLYAFNVQSADGNTILWSTQKQSAKPITSAVDFTPLPGHPDYLLGQPGYAARVGSYVITMRFRAVGASGATMYFVGTPYRLDELLAYPNVFSYRWALSTVDARNQRLIGQWRGGMLFFSPNRSGMEPPQEAAGNRKIEVGVSDLPFKVLVSWPITCAPLLWATNGWARWIMELLFLIGVVVLTRQKEQADERLKHLATHDSLTDLPNRILFSQLLDYSIKMASRYEWRFAVLFIDLDRFKLINDSLGHAAGDILITETANRLRGAVRTSDVIARLGGDEFVVLLNEITDTQQVMAVAGKLLTAISKFTELSGHEHRVTASIGIAMYPDDGTDEQTLMKRADIAMYLAKAEGKNEARFFSHEIITQSLDQLMVETDLQHALERNEFCLHYQPKLDVRTNRISGVEALLRWNHPKIGLQPPMQFIPAAEETGLIIPIGRWMMKTACTQAVAWQRQGLPLMSMAVNVSPRQFSDENLLRDIEDALAVSGMDPKFLQIEITESMVMLNVERAVRVLHSIHSHGVRLAIDDFGTGYSSMSMLKRFPIDTIKIDRSFIRDLPKNFEDRAISTAIISMGKALGLAIVAEGVETLEQYQFLQDQACDEIQGFLISEPIPADQIAELLLGHDVQ